MELSWAKGLLTELHTYRTMPVTVSEMFRGHDVAHSYFGCVSSNTHLKYSEWKEKALSCLKITQKQL